MRVVIVHDYLNQRGGAERVVGVLHGMYPNAPIHTLFVDSHNLWPSLFDANIIPSVLQRLPFIMKHFKAFFWLYPLGIRTINIPHCDVVITSSSAYAKGIRIKNHLGQKPVHICYCHTPMRFAWNYDAYIAHETSSHLLTCLGRIMVPMLKRWDVRSSRTVDVFVANSTVVRHRIRISYGKDAFVVHPPVDTRGRVPEDGKKLPYEYYLIVSRLVAYKNIDLAVKACTLSGRHLIVIGTGPDVSRLRCLAGETVQFLGWKTDEEVLGYMKGCKALIFPGEEDFGITPIEANAVGKPVLAYRGGGALDTIVEGINGIFFDQKSTESLLTGLVQLEATVWDSNEISRTADRFEQAHFESELRSIVKLALEERLATQSRSEPSILEGGATL